ncbi:MAG: TlpA family protein disulfide reductase [Nocardioides sp.]
MSRIAILLVALTAVCAGCRAGAEADDPDPDGRSVTVTDSGAAVTAALRKAKRQSGIEDCRPGDGEPVEGGPPAVTLPCLGGGPDVNLSRLRGPMIVNVWAQWCVPCKRELPIAGDFYRRHGDRVAMLGVDYTDQFPEAAIALAKRSKVSYPQVYDYDEQILRTTLMKAPVVPSWAFIDESGKVVAWLPEEIGSERELAGLVRQHLGLEL